MNITGENITESQLTTALGSLIAFAFDNEQAFFDRFYPGRSIDDHRLNELYFGERLCATAIIDSNYGSAFPIMGTIQTSQYIEWVENLRNLQGKGVVM